MDGKELMPSSDLPPFYAQHRVLGGGGHNSPGALTGMHGAHSVVRPMPNNMSMSPGSILQSIGGGSIGGLQFPMDSPLPMPHSSANPGSGAVQAAEPMKRKRGRPRKYTPDGPMKMPAATSASPPPRMGSVPGALLVPTGSAGLEDSAQKKRRGRPPGTGKKQQLATLGNLFSGSAGTSFTPHIITASPSEDIAAKIAAFANQGSRAVCILSANGSVSRVILRQPANASSASRVHSASAIATYRNVSYEGFFEILSLSGSYNLNEGSQNQTDGLAVTLSSPHGQVIGGILSGVFIAANTVQVVLGSFLHVGSKSKSKKAGKQPVFSSDSLTGGQDTSTSSGHNQNLTPLSVSGGWPGSTIFDTRGFNIDINSSRG